MTLTITANAAEERFITGLELETIIAQDPELNPCRIAATGVTVVNPVAFYIETVNGQVAENIVNQVSVLIQHEDMEQPVEQFTVPLTIAEVVPGYPNCHRVKYTPGTHLLRNGTTRYFGKSRLSHTSNPGIYGPWVSADAPFVLTGGMQEILAHKMRFGSQ